MVQLGVRFIMIYFMFLGLESLFPGYTIHLTEANGDCLFAAIADQLSVGTGKDPVPASAIRKQLIDFVRSNPSAFDDVSGAGL